MKAKFLYFAQTSRNTTVGCDNTSITPKAITKKTHSKTLDKWKWNSRKYSINPQEEKEKQTIEKKKTNRKQKKKKTEWQT